MCDFQMRCIDTFMSIFSAIALKRLVSSGKKPFIGPMLT